MEKMQKKHKVKKSIDSEGQQSRRTNSSAKVFSNLQQIVANDYKKRDDKREAKKDGKKHSSLPTHGQTSKRFKM